MGPRLLTPGLGESCEGGDEPLLSTFSVLGNVLCVGQSSGNLELSERD